MDPTLAALIGTGIGSIGTLSVPILASRRDHRTQRRALMRKVYADALAVVNDLQRVRKIDDLEEMRRRLLGLSIPITLDGTREASRNFQAILPRLDHLIEVSPTLDAEKRMRAMSELGGSVGAFLWGARRDIGADTKMGHIARKSFQRLRRKLSKR